MRLAVLVKPGAKQERAIRQPDGSLCIWVRERAQEGRANTAVCRVVAEIYGLPRSAVRITAGHRSRHKIIELPD